MSNVVIVVVVVVVIIIDRSHLFDENHVRCY